MISEQRRRAFLSAMQVECWLPAQILPFAARSGTAVQSLAEPQVIIVPEQAGAESAVPERAAPVIAIQPVQKAAEPFDGLSVTVAPDVSERVSSTKPDVPIVAVPRFSLQLYRAGACLLLVELPTGEAFQSRDPAYLLLKDLLRAAGLPDSPQLLGDPVRWPLLAGGNIDQGPQAARDFLQGFLGRQMEDRQGCVCLWLVGLPAMQHAAGAGEAMYNQHLQIDGLGLAWAIPGLELLMDEPQRKASLWQAMRRLMTVWQPVDD